MVSNLNTKYSIEASCSRSVASLCEINFDCMFEAFDHEAAIDSVFAKPRFKHAIKVKFFIHKVKQRF